MGNPRQLGRTFGRCLLLGVLSLAAGVAACGNAEEKSTFTREALLDPKTCGTCHQDHYRDWSGSMHAYAGEDPVFAAMNKRFLRNAPADKRDFCVRCHAPMAVIDKKTTDGENLAQLDPKYRGVTCFFCHTTESVEALHNNGLVRGDPLTMRGPFDDPRKNDAHESKSSLLHDQRKLASSNMCGSCHDIVTPGGAHIERTFAEWKETLFATEKGVTCGGCHMKAADGQRPVANTPGAVGRAYHSHTFAGVDRALTPFPNMEEQKREIQDFLDTSLQTALCVSRRGDRAQLRVILDNVFSGHSFPSGATSDRRVWVELIATKDGQTVYQSGVQDGMKPVLEGPGDPDLWLMRSIVFAGKGNPTHDFSQATCDESRLLPGPVTANDKDPRFYQRNIVRDYPLDGTVIPLPDTVSMRVRILPVGYEVLDELVADGSLDPAVRAKMEPMQVGGTLIWKPGMSEPFLETQTKVAYECVTDTQQGYKFNKFPLPVINTCR